MAYGIMRDMEKTTVYLSGEIRRGLEDASRRSGRPQAELIREALDAYLARQRRRKPKSIGVVNMPGLNLSERKRELREEWRHRLEEEGPRR